MPIAKIGTDTYNTSTTLSNSFSHTLVAGSNRMVAVSICIENGDTIDVSTMTYGGVTMTKGIEGITGTTGFRELVEIWYILEANLPSDGLKTVTVTMTGISNALVSLAYCAQYIGVYQGVPEASHQTQQTTGATITNTISPSNGSWVLSTVGAGNPSGSWAHGQSQVELLDDPGTGSGQTVAFAELRNAAGETALSSTFTGTVNRLQRNAISFRQAISLWVNVNGTFKMVTGAFVNVAGTWKQVTNPFVNASGTWKEVL